jgi:hypothetical protein
VAALLLWCGGAPAQQRQPWASAPPPPVPVPARLAVEPPPLPSPVEPPPSVQRTALQQPLVDVGPAGEESAVEAALIQLTPPGPERLFRLESEDSLMNRMKQEAMQRKPPERIDFPVEPVLSKDQYAGRSWPERDVLVEPNYVCYNKLLFEDPNSERYGWELGPLQPAVSTGLFFKDVLLLPYHLGADPCRTEVSAGHCLPGDPVPYLIAPPEWSISGGVAEAATILTLVAVFP